MHDPVPATDWDAQAYHQLSEPQLAWGRRVLAGIGLRGDETVLDVGCGTGRLTAELIECLPRGRVVAIDVSASMLQVAQAALASRFGRRIQFVRADAASLPLKEAADLVFSTATFHWIADHERLFASLHVTLKPGGRLEAQCGGGPNLTRLLGRASGLMADPAFAPFFRGWVDPWEFSDDASAATRLRAAGFVDVETSLEPAPVVLPDAATYRDFLKTVIVRAHMARLPPELQPRFAESLADEAASDDSPFSLDYWRLNLRGTKA